MRTTSILLFLCLYSANLFAQADNYLPKHKAGFFAGVEWNSRSGYWGFRLERTFLHREKLQVGAGLIQVMRYEMGNLELFGNDCCQTNRSTTLMAGADYFTSATGRPNRFYFRGGLGAGHSTRIFPEQRITTLFPAMEAGMGIQFPLSEGLRLQWHSSLLFLHNNGATTATGLSLKF